MKKLVVFLIPVLLLVVSCHKEPDMSKLDSDFVVFTDYDKGASFVSQATYYIPDSVLVITSNKEPQYWQNSQSEAIIAAVDKNMADRGYTKVADKSLADLGIQISFVKDAYFFYDYYEYPYWWWGYPGYWPPGYWWDYWDGWWWYYPYPVAYSYEVGSLLMEMINLKTPTPRTDNKVPIMWNSYAAGLLSSSGDVNTDLARRAIDQAFNQSQYIQRGR